MPQTEQTNKVISLKEAVEEFVHDGDHVTFGGFTMQRHPMAFIHEMLRQGKHDLVIYGHSPGIDADMLIGAGAVKRVIDTASGGKCLEENADWQQYVERLPGKATITVYVAVKRLVEFGRPVLAAKMQREGGGPGFGPSFAGLVIKALMELGECASGFGLKVVGDTGGVTVVSSSRHNGIDPVLVPVLTASLYSVRMDVRGGVEELPGPPPPPDRGGLIDEGEEFIGDELDLEELEEE